MAKAVSASRSLWASRPAIVTLAMRSAAQRLHVLEDPVRGGASHLAHDLAVCEEDDAIGPRGRAGIVRDHDDGLVAASSTALRRKPRSSAPERELRLPVGSTLKMMSGRLTRARAAATRCCCPPDSSPGRCVRRSFSRIVPMTSSSVARSGLRPAMARGSVMLSAAESVGTRLYDWKMNPTLARRSSVSCFSLSVPSSTEPMMILPDVSESKAGEAVEQGRLARAGWSHDGRELLPLERNADPVKRGDRGVPLAVHLDSVDCLGNHFRRLNRTRRRRLRGGRGICDVGHSETSCCWTLSSRLP